MMADDRAKSARRPVESSRLDGSRASAERRTVGALTFHHAPGFEDVVDVLAGRGPGELERVARAMALPVPPRLDVYLLPRQAGVSPPVSVTSPRSVAEEVVTPVAASF